MIDDLTRNILEQRDNIENQRNREVKSNEENYIKRLEQENKQLKEKVGELTQSLNEQMKLTNEENLDCSKYAIKNNQLKEVIEEVREYTEELRPHWLGNDLVLKIIDELLQILDKVKGE